MLKLYKFLFKKLNIRFCLIFFFLLYTHLIKSQLAHKCRFFDLACRQRMRVLRLQLLRQTRKTCNFKNVWLIPRQTDASCTRHNSKKLITIDTQQVFVQPSIIKFPGCFSIEVNNIQIHENDKILSNSLFVKTEYQWINVKDFNNLKCQNSSNDGCGGFGNNCYYCDICQSLKDLEKTNEFFISSVTNQFRSLNCPQSPGIYTFKKEFCFDDWSFFDKNNDCEIDFLSSEKTNVKSGFLSLQQIGYGTMVVKIRLAYNATEIIKQKKYAKELKIEKAVLQELNEQQKKFDFDKDQYERLKDWYIEYQKNLWHKEEYLPWLLYENEILCVRLTFDICEQKPSLRSYGPRNLQSYTCD